MAIIQKLRNSGAVVIAIVVALVLFVLGDVLTGSKYTGLSREDQDVIGEIFGEKVKINDLNEIFAELFKRESESNPDFKDDEKTRKGLIDQSWTTLIKRRTMEKQINMANIGISDEEFNEMIMGDYPIETVKGIQDFQTDGNYDVKKVSDLFKMAKTNKTLQKNLLDFVKNVKQQELEKHYTQYISKAQMKSKVEKEYAYVAANQGATGKAVAVNYSVIADKDVKVTDADLEKYLKEHREEYKQAFATRDIQYVYWEIIPNSEDTAYSKKQAEEFYTSWSKETKPDTAGEGVEKFTSSRELGRDSFEKAMYAPLASLPKNAMLPIMTIDGKYTIIQKLDEQTDTTNPYVKVAHILIPNNGGLPNKMKIADSAQAKALAFELLAKLKAGADFGALAKDYSGDPGSAMEKGIYDWAPASKYVPEFGKWCATHTKGDMDVVHTQFGFHVMKQLENPDKIKIKYRKHAVEVMPGPATIKLVDEASRKFRNSITEGDIKSFEAARDKLGLQPRVKKEIRTEDRDIPGLTQNEDVKTLLSWLFEAERKQNDVSDVFAFSTRHMVVIVTNARSRGYAEVKDVREKIEPLVRNELKAAKIVEKFEKALAGSKTAEEIAQKSGGTVIPLESVKMSSNFIPQLFTEPKILGAIFGVKEKAWSKPVKGANVVAILWIESKDKIEAPKTGFENQEDFANNPQFLSRRLEEIFRTKGEIQDYRYKFGWD
ncbi:MAG: peptidylprolyl isomerase [Bacteroidetes bacterium]|nr:peptidylprolyl isomerase [Bacteroidota bacterium]